MPKLFFSLDQNPKCTQKKNCFYLLLNFHPIKKKKIYTKHPKSMTTSSLFNVFFNFENVHKAHHHPPMLQKVYHHTYSHP